jgi:photosystem II stability/assembly factor-like uncharacterized protein
VANAQNKHIAHLTSFSILLLILLLLGYSAVSPGQHISAAAATQAWEKVNMPAGGAAGNWVLASGSDLQHLTAAADGTLYAYGQGLPYSLYKSTDGGLKWSSAGQVTDAITCIAVSPRDSATVYYATSSQVYRSTDGGRTFLQMQASPGGAGGGNIAITCLCVTWLNGNIVAVGTADADGGGFGGIYTLDETDPYTGWVDGGIGAYDVFAAAFSPNYALDRHMTVVATDETDTYVMNKIGNSGWNTYIGRARLDKDNSGIPTSVAATRAIIAFPGDFNALATAAGRTVYIGIATGTGAGDVYKIAYADTPGASPATDLNTGGAYGISDLDITGLAVYKSADATFLTAGAADSSQTYTSTDGGLKWTINAKEPTGGGATEVLFAPDYGSTGRIYAATSGAGSALSVSDDLGVTWNQVSFIDTIISTIVDLAPSPDYGRDSTLFMISFNVTSDLWRSRNGGNSWERILSGTYPGVELLSLVSLPPQYGVDGHTVLLQGETSRGTAIWISDDDGQSFRYQLTHDPATGATFPVNAWAIVNENTFFLGSYDGVHGVIYRTDNGGFFYSRITPIGAVYPYSMALSPEFASDGTVLVGDANGGVYLSTDGGASFQPLPLYAAAPPLDGKVTVAFDPDFAANHTVYAASDAIGSGIYRFTVGQSTAWTSIDTVLPAGAIISRLSISGDGILYAANDDINGGVERCLSPRSSSSPAFETMNDGLDAGAALYGLWQSDRLLWTIDTANCQLLMYDERLFSPVIPFSPPNAAASTGSLTGHAVKNVTLEWQTMGGAAGYEWQCSDDSDFSALPAGFSGTTSSGTARLPALEPATTYYWRVRVSSPVHSPWSAKQSFTTSLDTEIVTLNPETPAVGAKEVPLKPVFQWTAVVGAEAYDLLVATDADFSHPAIVKIGDYALPANAWQSDVSLDGETTYYWKVRATASGTASAWSAVGVFTTIAVPDANAIPTPTASPQPEPTPAAIHDAILALSVPENPPPPTTAPPPAPAAATLQLADLPMWLIYFVGGLLGIIILTLAILLAFVLKIRRIT